MTILVVTSVLNVMPGSATELWKPQGGLSHNVFAGKIVAALAQNLK